MSSVALLTMAGCTDENPLAPCQPEINNTTDSFQLQATGIKKVASTLDYNWNNTGTQANINQACAITSGEATLTIFDADSAQVYTRNLADNGTFVTAAGAAGTWRIRVALTNLSGTLNFRAQKKT